MPIYFMFPQAIQYENGQILTHRSARLSWMEVSTFNDEYVDYFHWNMITGKLAWNNFVNLPITCLCAQETRFIHKWAISLWNQCTFLYIGKGYTNVISVVYWFKFTNATVIIITVSTLYDTVYIVNITHNSVWHICIVKFACVCYVCICEKHEPIWI